MASNIVHPIRLVAIDGALHLPGDEPALLMRSYPAGDVDTCPWPMESPHASHDELRTRLAIALYDERECNGLFPDDAVIELPDGTVFDFDSIVP